jgi:hypothetical protein
MHPISLIVAFVSNEENEMNMKPGAMFTTLHFLCNL